MPAQPEETAPAKAGGRRWGNRRTQHRLYYRVIKIETPEASVSGVFNLGGIFRALTSAAVPPTPLLLLRIQTESQRPNPQFLPTARRVPI